MKAIVGILFSTFLNISLTFGVTSPEVDAFFWKVQIAESTCRCLHFGGHLNQSCVAARSQFAKNNYESKDFSFLLNLCDQTDASSGEYLGSAAQKSGCIAQGLGFLKAKSLDPKLKDLAGKVLDKCMNKFGSSSDKLACAIKELS